MAKTDSLGLNVLFDFLVIPLLAPLLDRLNLSPRTWLQLTVSLYASTVTFAWSENYPFSLLCFLGTVLTGRYLVSKEGQRVDGTGESQKEGLDADTPPQQVIDWYANMNSFIMTSVMSWLIFEKLKKIVGPVTAYGFSGLLMVSGAGLGSNVPILGNLLLNRDVLFVCALSLLSLRDPPPALHRFMSRRGWTLRSSADPRQSG